METLVNAGREFWRGVLIAGGFTAIPRWTCHPVTGVAEHEAPIPDDLAAALRRLADELAVPLRSVLLCLLYTSPSPRDGLLSRMPSSA